MPIDNELPPGYEPNHHQDRMSHTVEETEQLQAALAKANKRIHELEIAQAQEMSSLVISPFGTATLGSVVDMLKTAPKSADVQFDFCYLAPGKIASYRGYYDHLALGWKNSKEPPYWPKAVQLYDQLNQALGKVYEGYKGGAYRMGPETPLWVANWGETGGTGIIGIKAISEHTVVIETAKVN